MTNKNKPQYPYCCQICFNNGLYTCKRILNTDQTCMFYTTEKNKTFTNINNYENKQNTNNKRSE